MQARTKKEIAQERWFYVQILGGGIAAGVTITSAVVAGTLWLSQRL